MVVRPVVRPDDREGPSDAGRSERVLDRRRASKASLGIGEFGSRIGGWGIGDSAKASG
jgi:hypothetical protein